jgi:uncharacterized 2Fe-2S/4Fe-4S cluster protein (DUF4445 family)
MRAATGAIAEVTVESGAPRCRVLGGGEPRGICGSGLVDAVATGLDLGRIEAGGRLAGGAKTLPLAPPVALTQGDVRELQLAKGAVAAGFRILLERTGARASDVSRVYLAGAFGNYVNRASARRTGLLEFPPAAVRPSGNTALQGAKIVLFDRDAEDGSYASLRRRIEHVLLAADPQFQDLYAGAMAFPSGSDPETAAARPD